MQDRRLAKIHSLVRGTARVPMLRLTGKWPEEAGFYQGQELVIESRPKKLIIRAP